jgi:DNA (cytosine-5)-methyltransferase 1
MVTYFSMFSGIGGFENGIEKAFNNKYESEVQQDEQRRNGDIDERASSVCSPNESPLCVGYSEIDKYATAVYQYNYRGHKNYGDATKINPDDLPDFDLLVGGFPCQAFSIAGKRAGFSDTRGTLFYEIARIAQCKRPRYMVLENVKGLLNHDKGKTFTTILQTLWELGYEYQCGLVNSRYFGVPQNRERIIIVCNLRGERRPEVFPLEGKAGELIQQIASTMAKVSTTEVWFNGFSIRRLTPTECERLQGFTDDWTKFDKNGKQISDTQRYKMCGNAVTTNVIEAIMTKLFDGIEKKVTK